MADLFNQKADEWDGNELVRALSSAIGASILTHVPLHDGMEVMDFGAGTGLISAHVAPRVRKIIAVDISEAMLGKLVAKPQLQGKVEACCQDITDIPLDVRFDLIISAMAMHHVEDTHKLMRAFRDHLKPGAMVALADLDKEPGDFHAPGTEGIFHFGFERADLQGTLEAQGFQDVRFVTAHTVGKEDRRYPVFLVTARRGER